MAGRIQVAYMLASLVMDVADKKIPVKIVSLGHRSEAGIMVRTESPYPHETSGGMLKRAELARAFVVKPDILCMDEPFSALDALMNLRMRNELMRILGEEKRTVLLITHDVEEAIYMADRIMVLSPRPTTIQASFRVDRPHPRKLSSPEAQTLREAVLKELGL